MGEYYLAHHGVEGMKWGIRRYQNEDGSLTDLGRQRYAGKKEHPNSTLRKIASFNAGSLGARRVSKLEEKAGRLQYSGKEKDSRKAEKLTAKANAQKAHNENRKLYILAGRVLESL